MTSHTTPLYLHEEVLLLELRDEAGTTVLGSMHDYAKGGAILACNRLMHNIRSLTVANERAKSL